jgi:mannose-6-phosphate isomerase-like protein (cupin superfamily)
VLAVNVVSQPVGLSTLPSWSSRTRQIAPRIETHDETSFVAGGREELYLAVSGRARFTVAGRELDAPAGSLLLV